MKELRKELINRKACPVGKALQELGEKWVLLLLRELFYGFHRFEDFQQNLDISRSVLASKLSKMVEDGLVEKRLYQRESERPRHAYYLTKKGKDLFKIIVAMSEWGNRYLVEEGEETIVFVDADSGNKVQLSYTDEQFQPVQPKKVVLKRHQK